MDNFLLKDTYVGYRLCAKSDETRKAAIFLMGVPGTPKDYDVFDFFNTSGYDIFLPRYEGTWESKGLFLNRGPSYAINELISSIETGLNIGSSQNYESNHIVVIGASFGGGVALSIGDSDSLKLVCAISPVIKFENVAEISTLDKYLTTSQEGNYRFSENQWSKLIKDQLYNVYSDFKVSTKKTLVFAGKNDPQIKHEEIEKFSSDKKIKCITIEDAGHLTLSKVTYKMFELMLDMIL